VNVGVHQFAPCTRGDVRDCVVPGDVDLGRHHSGADLVAMGQRGQAGDMPVQDTGELLRLGLAQHRELTRRVDDRAVVLAQLDRHVTQRRDLGGVSRTRENRRSLRQSGVRVEGGVQRLRSLLGELRDRGFTEFRCHVAQSSQGEVVIGRIAGRAPSIREAEHASGPAPATLAGGAIGRLLVNTDEAFVNQCGQGSPNTCCGHPQDLSQLGRREGPVAQ